MRDPGRWITVLIYAIAMALVEAAVVAYLRTLIGSTDPYRAGALTLPAWMMRTEIAREAATLVMLGTVAWLAGRNWRTKLGYFLAAFGVWDIFYYLFLATISGWPRSLLAWDVLFLIPLPWWGPVLAPLSIAVLMLVLGTQITQFGKGERSSWPSVLSWSLCCVGTSIALYVFMADAIHAPKWDAETLNSILPFGFDWLLFVVALALMAAPVIELVWWCQTDARGSHEAD
ncbi:MAG: hypothetical protein JSW48_11410 [Betaproteobacteria bacterium]|jgi:hypothetical protein|nr:MAG: hypothetical protein JSW48_11410 [Betaproteobacteria bacterium]